MAKSKFGHTIETQIAEYERKIVVERSKISSVIPREEVQEYIQQALRKEPKTLIELLVRQIVLYDDKMIIYFNYTKQTKTKSLDESQGSSFYTKIVSFAKPNTSSNTPTIIPMVIEMRV